MHCPASIPFLFFIQRIRDVVAAAAVLDVVVIVATKMVMGLEWKLGGWADHCQTLPIGDLNHFCKQSN